MTKIETRAYDTDLEIRNDGDGRTICGICVPYDVEQRIHHSLVEVFRRGVFSRVVPNAHRVKMLVGHDAQALPIGRATLLREDAAGLYGEFRVSKGSRADDILELVRDGALSELSIGFAPLKDNRRPDGVVERLAAHLAEVSLVTFGAYGQAATVVGVRDQSTTPNLDAVDELLRDLKR
jgi:HK97 family phage prohead protease